MADPLKLEGKLDITAVGAVHDSLLALKTEDIVIDLGKVTYIGALCLQLCIAAARQAKAVGRSFSIVNTPDAVLAQITTMGLTPETIAEGAL